MRAEMTGRTWSWRDQEETDDVCRGAEPFCALVRLVLDWPGNLVEIIHGLDCRQSAAQYLPLLGAGPRIRSGNETLPDPEIYAG